MFEKNLKIALLLDCYGVLLDEHTKAVMDAYYEDDLSLKEIADGLGISRQGVRHVVKKGEELLLFYDTRLGLSRLYSSLEEAKDKLTSLLDSQRIDDPEVKKIIEDTVKLISDK